MTVKSVRPFFQIGDLVGFVDDDRPDRIDDLGVVVKAPQGHGWFKIVWDDGLHTQILPPTTATGNHWVNLGKNTEQLRLFIRLKYMEP
jgi:hypothetical protein